MYRFEYEGNSKPDWEDQEQTMYTPQPTVANHEVLWSPKPRPPAVGPIGFHVDLLKKYETPPELVEKLKKAVESVKSPSHYKKSSSGVESIEATMASMSSEALRGHLKGNVQKYVWRYEDKAEPLQDLKKAERYLKWLIEHLETGKITV